MVKKRGGFRRGSRKTWQKPVRKKGKISLRMFFQSFNEGDKVQLIAEPAYQKGVFRPQFEGKVGKVIGKQGDCYLVEVYDHTQRKTFIVHPVHLSVIK